MMRVSHLVHSHFYLVLTDCRIGADQLEDCPRPISNRPWTIKGLLLDKFKLVAEQRK